MKHACKLCTQKTAESKGEVFPVHTTRAEVEIHSFLSTALVGSEWLTSCSGRYTSWKEPPIATE